MTVFLVTVEDVESTIIMGVFSTRELAKEAAAGIDVIKYGRNSPYVFPVTIDKLVAMWGDGTLYEEEIMEGR